MPISFNSIPQGWKLPLVYIEVDPSQAGTPTSQKYALLVDYKLAAGDRAARRPDRVRLGLRREQSRRPVARRWRACTRAFFRSTSRRRSCCCRSRKPGAGVAATGTITVTAPATQAGELALYIAGQKVSVGVAAADPIATVATNIAAAITALPDLPVTAAAAGAVVTLTSKWKGITGQRYRARPQRARAERRRNVAARASPSRCQRPASSRAASASRHGRPRSPTSATSRTNTFRLGFNDSGTLIAWETEYGFSRLRPMGLVARGLRSCDLGQARHLRQPLFLRPDQQ